MTIGGDLGETATLLSVTAYPGDTLTVTLAGTGSPTVAVCDSVTIGSGTGLGRRRFRS